MKKVLLILTLLLLSLVEGNACSCSRPWNDSFSRTAKSASFIALVKIVSFDEFLNTEFNEAGEPIPYAMTAEIIRQYKGEASSKRIRIVGDNGILCRPYLNEFELNGYYLIAPKLEENATYYFHVCTTDYLTVDYDAKKVRGKYSLLRSRISLNRFENKLNNGDYDLLWASLIVATLIAVLWVLKRKKQDQAHHSPNT